MTKSSGGLVWGTIVLLGAVVRPGAVVKGNHEDLCCFLQNKPTIARKLP